jgi:hypothetical protein
MCRSNAIIYQNETKFEINCNDKTESHHITEKKNESAINTITWVWTKSLIIHTYSLKERITKLLHLSDLGLLINSFNQVDQTI